MAKSKKETGIPELPPWLAKGSTDANEVLAQMFGAPAALSPGDGNALTGNPSKLFGEDPVPQAQTILSLLTAQQPTAPKPGEKVADVIDTFMGRYDKRKSQLSKEVSERASARNEDAAPKDLGRMLATVLGTALMGKETGARASMPTIAAVNSDTAYRKAMGMQDQEDSNTALKGYYEMLMKGLDHYDTIGGGKQAEPFANADQFQDENGYWFNRITNQATGKIENMPVIINGVHIKGAKPMSATEWSMARWNEDFQSTATREVTKLNEDIADTDKDIQELMKDDKAIPEKYKNDPRFSGMSGKDIVEVLKNAQQVREQTRQTWQKRAGWEVSPGFYTEKGKTFKFGSDSGSSSTKKPQGM